MTLRIPRFLLTLALLFVVLASLAPTEVRADRPAHDDHKPGELIVRFKPGAAPKEAVGARLAGVATSAKRQVFSHLGMEHWKLPEGTDLQSTMQTLRGSGMVEFVEPNYRRYLRVTEPCDQWGLGDMKVDASVPPESSGLVRVAVIDTGVDATHPELEGNVVTGRDVIDDDDDASPEWTDTSWWHGTAVASVIGAAGVAFSGVAPHVSIVPIRTNFYMDSLLKAYNAAIEKQVHIINASWGGPQFSMAESEGIKLLEENEILLVAAAGNYEIDNDLIPDYPSGLPNANIIAVAATGQDGNLTYWSQYGARDVDLAAPGERIKVAVPVAYSAKDDDYGCYSGTSFSAPHVTGLAALLMSQYPDANLWEIKARIMASVQALESGRGLLATDGRVNVQAALAISEQPAIVYSGHILSEAEGNGNGVLEPDESGELSITLENLWAEANNVCIRLSSGDPLLELIESEACLDSFPRGKQIVRFRVRFAPDANGHQRIPLRLTMHADGLSEMERHFMLEWSVLSEGVTSGAIIQTHSQDDMHLWTFHLTSPMERLQFALNGSAGDLDLLVRQGGVPQFDWYYCERKSTLWCAEKGTWVSTGRVSDESIVINDAQPGVYYVSVANIGQTKNVAYTLRASAGSAGGGGEGAWLVAIAAIGLMLRWHWRRVYPLCLAVPLLLMGCASAHTATEDREPVVPGEYLVTFADHVEPEDARQWLQEAGAQILRTYAHLPIFHIRAPAGMTAEEVQTHFRQLPDVLAVEPNVRRRPYIDP